MFKRMVLFGFIFIFTFTAVFAQRGTARGETVQIRFASPLPRNSDWGRALDRLAAEWQTVTNGAVRVVMSHDGREGNEERMLTSLSSNAIQAALFTSNGMAEICPPVMTLSIPFMIRNDTELDLVLNELKPILESRVHRDFVVIAWSKGGWIYVFSKEPVFTPDDLRRQRLASGGGSNNMNNAFRSMGFQIVESDLVNIGTRLASNMINAIYILPAAVAPMQLHRHLNNMLNIPIAPIMGAIVMNRVTWNTLSADHQRQIVRTAQRVAVEFDNSMPRTETEAITSMSRYGLTVNRLTQVQDDLWRREMDKTMPSLVGSIFDRDIYQRMNVILERARSGH